MKQYSFLLFVQGLTKKASSIIEVGWIQEEDILASPDQSPDRLLVLMSPGYH